MCVKKAIKGELPRTGNSRAQQPPGDTQMNEVIPPTLTSLPAWLCAARKHPSPGVLSPRVTRGIFAATVS